MSFTTYFPFEEKKVLENENFTDFPETKNMTKQSKIQF